MLLRMFQKRLRGYRSLGYARGEAPLGLGEPGDDLVVEYDEEVLRSLKERDEFGMSAGEAQEATRFATH